MTFKLAFHPLARADLLEASAWHELRELGLGERLETEARVVFERLKHNALHYAVRFGDIRRVNLPFIPLRAFLFCVQRQSRGDRNFARLAGFRSRVGAPPPNLRLSPLKLLIRTPPKWQKTYSRKFWKFKARGKSCARTAAMTACSSSRLLLVTRTWSPKI